MPMPWLMRVRDCAEFYTEFTVLIGPAEFLISVESKQT